MANDKKQTAVGDSSDTRATETDLHGARTAVGVPHPENRPDGQTLPAVDLSDFELDDYDDDKQGRPSAAALPPDQDAGESFREIVDVGETAQRQHRAADTVDNPDRAPMDTPTVDNQINQPDRFHNREPKGRAG